MDGTFSRLLIIVGFFFIGLISCITVASEGLECLRLKADGQCGEPAQEGKLVCLDITSQTTCTHPEKVTFPAEKRRCVECVPGAAATYGCIDEMVYPIVIIYECLPVTISGCAVELYWYQAGEGCESKGPGSLSCSCTTIGG